MSQTQLALPLAPEISIATVLLVDFENVRELPLASLSLDWEVIVFVGRSQNSIPFDFATRAQQLGNRQEIPSTQETNSHGSRSVDLSKQAARA